MEINVDGSSQTLMSMESLTNINVDGISQTLMSTRSLMQFWSFPLNVCASTLMSMDDLIINQSNDYVDPSDINVDAQTLNGNYPLR